MTVALRSVVRAVEEAEDACGFFWELMVMGFWLNVVVSCYTFPKAAC